MLKTKTGGNTAQGIKEGTVKGKDIIYNLIYKCLIEQIQQKESQRDHQHFNTNLIMPPPFGLHSRSVLTHKSVL